LYLFSREISMDQIKEEIKFLVFVFAGLGLLSSLV
jgi:hypothetical protein